MSPSYNDYDDYVSSLNPGGDDYEERMRLENTIYLPDISLSTHPSDVEYPRHLPDSHLARSYDSAIYGFRDSGDEEGYSLSTLQHHVSGLTLSAGFGWAKSDAASGTEYDADRPLSKLNLNQAKHDMSVFSRSNKPSLSTRLQEQKPFSPKRPSRHHGKGDKENDPLGSRSEGVSPRSQPARSTSSKKGIRLPDITGITAGASSPRKPPSPLHSDLPSDQRVVASLQRQLEDVTRDADDARQKVKELEQELSKRRDLELHWSMQYNKERTMPESAELQEVVKEKKALESLVESLRLHQSRLDQSLKESSDQLSQLRRTISQQDDTISGLRAKLSHAECALQDREILYSKRTAEIRQLRDEIARLQRECHYLKGCVDEGLVHIENQQYMNSFAAKQSAPAKISSPKPQKLRTALETSEPSLERRSEWSARISTPTPPSRSASRLGNDIKTQATLGEGSTKATRFIEESELSRVQSEILERRSERSHSSHSQSSISPQLIKEVDTIAVTVTKVNRPSEGRRLATPDSVVADPCPIPTKEEGVGSAIHNDIGRTPKNRRLERATEVAFDSPRVAAMDSTPFPQIRGKHMERLFFSAPPHDEKTCPTCRKKRRRTAPVVGTPQWLRMAKKDQPSRHEVNAKEAGTLPDQVCSRLDPENIVPPQTILARVLSELENDFTHYKSIYCELADQYKIMDAASNVAKRNVLAEHLREVIEVLEKKGDQIASLYELLTFNDKVPSNTSANATGRSAPLR